MKTGIITAAILSACAAFGDIAIQAPMGQAPSWGVQKVKNTADTFQFVVLADRAGGQRPGVFANALEKVNLLGPDFVLCVGDLIEGYTDNTSALAIMYEDLDKTLAKLKPPFFFVPGNHDLSNPVEVQYYKEHRGPLYYHFVHQDVLFLCLCSEDSEDGLGADQLAYAKKALADQPNARWTFLFLHRPLWRYDSKSWAELESALASRKYTVFAGHEHSYMKFERQGRDYYMLGTTGGESELWGPDTGRVDHVTLVTVGSDQPTVANLTVDGILPDNFVDDAFCAKFGNIGDSIRPVIETLLLDAETFESGKSTLRFTNTVKMPAKVTAVFPPGLPFKVTPQAVQFAAAPAENHSIELAIAAEKPVRLDTPLFGYADLDMEFDSPDGKQKMADRCRFVVDRQFWCGARASAVTIDGDLAEWTDLPVVLESDMFKDWTSTTNWNGAEDSSGRFAAAYDEHYVYFAARVRDSEVILDPNRFVLEQDGVGVFLDLNPQPQSVRAAIDLGIGLSPGQPPKNPYTSEPLPEQIRSACVKTADGYAAEIAVPIQWLQQKQGGDWRKFRANLAINDVDADGRALLWWRPAWDSLQLYPDSGLFLRK